MTPGTPFQAIARTPAPYNEPIRSYAPGTPERASMRRRLESMAAERVEIASVIGGREVRTGKLGKAIMPHRHQHVLADVHLGGPPEVAAAIAAARAAAPGWAATPWEDRAAIILRAAELLAGPWREILNAATMLGQSKTVHQAEIDAAAELIDFWRFNVEYLVRIYSDQPISSPGVWNRVDYRPLEGFVFAVSPFNFTSIGGNLSTAPALMGNTVVWKPASTAAYAAHVIMDILREAGLPDGVVNLVYGSGATIGDAVIASEDLAGIHFTGSTEVFQGMWKRVGQNIAGYRGYPRLVGETGGKNFVLAHASADVDALVAGVVRGGFEYQGQKCSAASRLFVPRSLWKAVSARLEEEVGSIRMGDVADFGNFMGAVIDQPSLDKHREAIEEARAHKGTSILVGGGVDDSVGYFVEPTVVVTDDPQFRLLREELFGPIVTAFVYPDAQFEDTIRMIDTQTPYALTGSIFAQDRAAVLSAQSGLRQAAGNFYINDKPTGAVVGQQPFGGARASGTNDKAGSMWNLIRWASPRSIKEVLAPPRDYRYPFLSQD